MQGTIAVRQVSYKTTLRLSFIILLLTIISNDARLIAAVYERDSPSILLIICGYVIAFCSILFILLNRSKWIRTIGQILLFSSLYTDALYLILGDFPFSYPDAINLFNNPDYASGAFTTFIAAFVFAFIGAAIIYACLYTSITQTSLSFPPASSFLFLAIQLFLYCLPATYVITDFMPSVHRVTGNLANANKSRPEEHWRRTGVSELPGSNKVRHVFIVVDESISGTALPINGSAELTTPFLHANADRFINFGRTASFTNFSAGSNLSLISGMLLNELPDIHYKAFSKPSIFQFAKKAGYKTFLLDAQTVNHKLQNYFTTKDLVFIDSLFQPGDLYPSIHYHLRDSILSEKLVEIAGSDTPAFVYVNKAGAHWPYETNVPEGVVSNKLLPLNKSEVSQTNNYFKSIYWNVDKFWMRLVNKLDTSSNTLVIYTSDHGENYAAPTYKMKRASIYNSSIIEGTVPLFVLDYANFFPAGFSAPADKYTHQYIFPTLLKAMGFDSLFITREYGRSLLEQPYSNTRWFQTGDLFGRGKTTAFQ